jgi:nucleoside-diphosphate-sugar epimerase
VKPLPLEDLDHVYTQTLPLWEGVRGRRLFITGGTGFFGAWLLETFACVNRRLKLQAEAIVLTRDRRAALAKLPHLSKESSIQWLEGDVCSFSFPDGIFDYVIHAAAPTLAAASSQPMALMRTLIHGTERVIDFAGSRRTKSLLFTSSGAVYGRQPEAIRQLTENYYGGPDWLETGSVYAEGKRIAEQICSIAARQSSLLVSIARCFAFVGPHLPLNEHFAIGNFIRDALAGKSIVIRGDGTPLRSYLYSADLTIWLWTMLLRKTGPEEPCVLNVGSGEAISIRDLAHAVVEEINPALQIEIVQQTFPGKRIEQYVPSVEKAKLNYGLCQTIDLREAIRRTAAWHH